MECVYINGDGQRIRCFLLVKEAVECDFIVFIYGLISFKTVVMFKPLIHF